jgi:hypothetical protein
LLGRFRVCVAIEDDAASETTSDKCLLLACRLLLLLLVGLFGSSSSSLMYPVGAYLASRIDSFRVAAASPNSDRGMCLSRFILKLAARFGEFFFWRSGN